MVTILILQSFASSSEPMASRHASHPLLTTPCRETATQSVGESIKPTVPTLYSGSIHSKHSQHVEKYQYLYNVLINNDYLIFYAIL